MHQLSFDYHFLLEDILYLLYGRYYLEYFSPQLTEASWPAYKGYTYILGFASQIPSFLTSFSATFS